MFGELGSLHGERESVSMQGTQRCQGHKKERLTDKPDSFLFIGCICIPQCSSTRDTHRPELVELMEMLIQIPTAVLLCWPVQRLHQIALFKTAPARLCFWFSHLCADLWSLV